ncbi:MAG: outer membrane protein [Sphingobacteriales bacterium]|jgi:outer membrane protein
MRVSIIAAFFLLSGSLMAQRSFSLQEALDYSAKNGYQYRLSEMDLEKAKQKVKETIAIGLPQVNAKASYQNFLKQPVQVVPAEFFGGQAGEFAEVIFGTKQNASAEISASQLLFDGSYIVGLQATKAFVRLSEEQVEKSKLDTKVAVAEAYSLVLAAQENVRILSDNQESMEKMLLETKAMYDIGFVAEEDVDQLDITVSRVKSKIKNAENQVKIAMSLLKFRMGVPIDVEILLTDNVEGLITTTSSPMDMSGGMSFSRNINVSLARTNATLQKLSMKNAKAGYLPRVAAFASYQQNSFANDFNFLNPEAKWFPTAVVGLNLDIPIFSSGMKHQKVAQAKVEYQKARVQERMAKEGARLEFETASTEYLNAQEIFQLEKRNLALSKKVKETTSIKFKEGLSSSFELVQSESQLAQSQGAYIQSIILLLNAKTKLDKALNRL